MASQASSTSPSNHHHSNPYSTHHVTVYIIRHGEREDEAARKKRNKHYKVEPPKPYKEKLDPALTKEGYNQAMEAFQSLSNAYEQKQCNSASGGKKRSKYRAFLFASPLRRTIGTAMMSSFADSNVLDFTLPVTTATTDTNASTREANRDGHEEKNDVDAMEVDEIVEDYDESKSCSKVEQSKTESSLSAAQATASFTKPSATITKNTSNIIVMNGLCDCAAAVHNIGGAANAVKHQFIDCAAFYREKDLEEDTFIPRLVEMDERFSRGMAEWKQRKEKEEENRVKETEEKKSHGSPSSEKSIIKSMTSMMSRSNRRLGGTTSSNSSTSPIQTEAAPTTAATEEEKKRPLQFWKEMTSATKTFLDGDDITLDAFEPMTSTLDLGRIDQHLMTAKGEEEPSKEKYKSHVDRMGTDSSSLSTSNLATNNVTRSPPTKRKKYDETLASNDDDRCGVEAFAVECTANMATSKKPFCPDQEHETFMGAVNRAAYLTALAKGDVCVIVSHREGIRYLAQKMCGYKDRHHNFHHVHSQGQNQQNHRLSTPYCCIGSFEAKVKIPQRQPAVSSSSSTSSPTRKRPYSVKWTFHGVTHYENFQVTTKSSEQSSLLPSLSSRSITPSISSGAAVADNSSFIELVLAIPGEQRHALSILSCHPEDNAFSAHGAIVAKKLPRQIEITWYEFMHGNNNSVASAASPSPRFTTGKKHAANNENVIVLLRILDGRRNLASFCEWLYKQSRLAHGTVAFQGNDEGSSKNSVVVLNPSHQPILPCPPPMVCLNIQTTDRI